MWFGDLVTMRWWDDLWLNESFAEYLGHRVTGRGDPLDRLRRSPPQGLGATPPTSGPRPTRSPATASSTPTSALHRLRRHLVRQGRLRAAPARRLARRRGVPRRPERPLRRHRFGNATLADLLGSLSASSGTGPVRLGRAAGCAARRSTPCVPRSPWTSTVATPRWRWCRPRPSRTRCCAHTGSAWAATRGRHRAARRGGHRPDRRRRPDRARGAGRVSRRRGCCCSTTATSPSRRSPRPGVGGRRRAGAARSDRPAGPGGALARGTGRGDRRRAAGHRPGRPDGRRAARRDRGDHRGGRADAQPGPWSTATSTR